MALQRAKITLEFRESTVLRKALLALLDLYERGDSYITAEDVGIAQKLLVKIVPNEV